MNIFVLNTGRCGSTTFIAACRHITNYSSAHESRCDVVGAAHFAYPENHIEADNRLSWFLGRLDKHYGDDAFYVHLTRNAEEAAASFTKRYDRGIIRAYKQDVLKGFSNGASPLDVSRDYCETVTANIELFLKDKTRKMDFRLENAKEDFRAFWERIGAEGDLEAALAEFDTRHNATKVKKPRANVASRLTGKARRLIAKFPAFVRTA